MSSAESRMAIPELRQTFDHPAWLGAQQWGNRATLCFWPDSGPTDSCGFLLFAPEAWALYAVLISVSATPTDKSAITNAVFSKDTIVFRRQ